MDKILGFLEDHVEKMVVGIVAVICLWLLVTRVVLNPNAITYDRKNLSLGSIDDYVLVQARELEDVLNGRPTPPDSYNPRLAEYTGILACSVKGVNFGLGPAVPQTNPPGGTVVKEYSLPDTGRVGDVAVGHIRAVAYTPLEEVTADRAYDGSISEPNDLDFVTVQGKYDIAALYASFKDSFAGTDVKIQWRDPCLAEPVFAAVQLQRQEKNDDGIWDQWRDVPRTRIDYQRELLTIIEDARSLPPGGLTVRMMRYRDRAVQQDLLQPEAYRIASADEEWFPPLLYRQYKEIQASEALDERRRARDEENISAGSDTTGQRRTSSTSGRMSLSEGGRDGSAYTSGQTRSPTSSSRRTDRSGGAGRIQEGGRYSSRTRPSGGRAGQEDLAFYYEGLATGRDVSGKPTVENVRLELDKISITKQADLRTLEELIFWAHDDSIESGKQYRYRVRLGVFNPVAGKNQLSQRDAAHNNEVILWSEFSDVSQEVEIPRRMYFFAKGLQEAAKEVTVQVSKYVLGDWYSEDFKVRGGEVIGDLAKVEIEAPKTTADATGRTPYRGTPYMGTAYMETAYRENDLSQDAAKPKEVDYDTGAMLVDVVAVNDFAGDNTMRERHYFEMLYSYDGMLIERMPVGDRYWPDELRVVRTQINNSQREPKQPWRPWSGTGQTGRTGRTGRTTSGPDEYYEEYYRSMERY